MITTKVVGINKFILEKLKDYVALTKASLSAMVVLSSSVAYVLGCIQMGLEYSFLNVLWITLGGWLVTASANAINQIIEKDTDKLMDRTKLRPLPDGRMQTYEAMLAAGVLAVSGVLLIAYQFNLEAAFYAAVSLLIYAFIYTPLKRYSSIAVFIGAIPGALPPLIGYVAATGAIDLYVLIIFGIQFLWQFPHFWAIAWLKFDDYKKAGIHLLPSLDGKDGFSAFQTVVYSFMLIPVSLMPYFMGFSSKISAVVFLFIGVLYFLAAVQLWTKQTDQSAKTLMFASFGYLPIALFNLLIFS